MKQMKLFTAVLLPVLAVMAGCGTAKEPAASGKTEQVESSEPITLTMMQDGAALSDEEFQALFAEPVKKAYPNITLELVRSGTKGNSPAELVAAGTFPDLVFASSRSYFTFTKLKVPTDLTETVKKNNLDLTKFEPSAIEAIRNYGDRGELYGIPMFVNVNALYYNKDIFDKFALPYPKDGMTWEETIDLAKRTTRMENNIQYAGLDTGSFLNFASGMALPYADAKTGKAKLLTDEWKKVCELYKQITDIPGNKAVGGVIKAFMSDQTLAMMANFGGRIGELEQQHNQGKPMNWDLASYPSFREHPGKAAEMDVHFLSVSSMSGKKDAAFKVIALLTGEDNQSAATKRGRLSAWKDPKMKEQFGVQLNALKGKNVAALFANTPIVPKGITIYDDFAKDAIGKQLSGFTSGQMDVNSMLRQAEEAANQAIASELAK